MSVIGSHVLDQGSLTMPELPELEVVRDVLKRRVVGQSIRQVSLIAPGSAIVVRDLTNNGFAEALTGATFAGVERRGKFLVLSLTSAQNLLYLIVNLKLTGRFQLWQVERRREAQDANPAFAQGVCLEGWWAMTSDQVRFGQAQTQNRTGWHKTWETPVVRSSWVSLTFAQVKHIRTFANKIYFPENNFCCF